MEKRHNPSFWSIVESVMPDHNERKDWLKTNGENLDI